MDNGSVHGWHLRRVVSFFRFCASMLYRRIAKSFLRPSIPTREDHSFIVMPIYSCALRIKWWRGWNGRQHDETKIGRLVEGFLFLGGESTFERSSFSPCRLLFFSKLIVLGLLSIHGEMRSAGKEDFSGSW